MGAYHSDLKHKEGETNSLEESKITTGSNLSLAEGKEPPTFQELCARQQDLFARSDALKRTVAQNNNRRSFRSELADIVLKGPKRPLQHPEEESEVIEDDGKPGPSTPRVKLSYRRPTIDDHSTPEMKAVVNKYFNTLEELKRFVVSDEIYLDGKAPPTEDKAGDCEQDLGKEDRGAVESNDSAGKENTHAEPITVEESGDIVEQVDCLAQSGQEESSSASVKITEHSADIFNEESTSPQTTPEKKKKKKSQKTKKSKNVFSCFSSENCE